MEQIPRREGANFSFFLNILFNVIKFVRLDEGRAIEFV
jgi:hypothetical protein